MKNKLMMLAILGISSVSAWEDHPDRPEASSPTRTIERDLRDIFDRYLRGEYKHDPSDGSDHTIPGDEGCGTIPLSRDR
jgi:hypothetical protein